MRIKFAKVKEGAHVPSKRDEDAAFDIYACFNENYIRIDPFTSKLIPTGIASVFSSDYAVVFRERGSTGTKNIKVNAGVIDSGFRGEYFVSLYNANDVPLYICKDTNYKFEDNAIYYPYSKAIAQALVIHVPHTVIEEISYEDLLNIKSERGIGQLGSSNK